MPVELSAQEIWNDIQRIHDVSPLVHNITNYVVMNTTANALLAIGASPVMAHAQEEIADMVGIASALVINIGTLSRDWIVAMKRAMESAAEKAIPIIFDPVGAGATAFRTRTCHELLEQVRPTVIRGNASEIMALVDSTVQTKGVDSLIDIAPVKAAQSLAKRLSCVVVVSGESDLIADGRTCVYTHNGHSLMPKVTGLGCTASALMGAFSAVQSNPLLAAAHTMAVMGICGEIAAERASGPGSLQMHFIDSLYQLSEQQIVDHLKG
ncbi:MAG: hydroxyethylthiazole kinase [Deltaproteobacteria bacterium]|jgi:hydroxyethylthiazole kinase|nr:hydroxyethylthiazole kinase [Deltaproteobacteria bacterium]MCW8894108.1 hydroxyethylthiazole kinase [Deltaproteobacteria bacterium]